ncbi:MAG: hypothetical protein K2F74_02800 [Muribaculaceae bacterium]|nr:hypothetical protein [Muribaculaceae bacterium]
MRRLLAISLAILCAVSMSAQRTWRGRHHIKPDTYAAIQSRMTPCDSSMISAAGFEKTLRSSIESLFLSNHTADTVSRVFLHIEYLDTGGRQLHCRGEHIGIMLPPASTRRVELRSFDRQGTLYYHLSPPPRTKSTATPFMVKLRVDSLSYLSNPSEKL